MTQQSDLFRLLPTPKACAIKFVFYAGIQRCGTSTFQRALQSAGYAALKFPHEQGPARGSSKLDEFYANASLPSIFDAMGGRAMAWSDFPIFGRVCELSKAYPEARFLYFERDIDEWYDSERSEILCNWMGPESAVLRRRSASSQKFWEYGVAFMHRFWGDSFSSFLEKRNALCADLNHTSWQSIEAGFKARFRAHRKEISACIPPSRLLWQSLNSPSPEATSTFLGCPRPISFSKVNTRADSVAKFKRQNGH